MKAFFSDVLGGLLIIVLASALGVVINSARPGGVALIQKGAPVSTVKAGAGSDTTAPAIPAEGTVALSEMKRIWDTGRAFIIDSRDPKEFKEGHIPGAINIPHDRIPEYLDVLMSEIPTDGEVIVYCRGPNCDFSDRLATELRIIGYNNVRVFPGGWEQWTAAGYPVDGMVPK